MNIAKTTSKAERAAIESRFARINWNAHLVPIVRLMVGEFGNKLQAEGNSSPHLSLLSEAVKRNQIETSSHLGDSVSIQFGVRPIATNSMSPLGTIPPILVEKRASLVFSQVAASGVVMVFIYPPSSEVSKPTQPYYLIDSFKNPSQLTKLRVKQLLQYLFEIDICCTTQTTPSVTCDRMIVKLEARAKAIQSGSAGIFAYVKYVSYLVRGLWYLYRASHAT